MLADRKPAFSELAWIYLLVAVFIGITTLVKEPFLAHLPRLIGGQRSAVSGRRSAVGGRQSAVNK